MLRVPVMGIGAQYAKGATIPAVTGLCIIAWFFSGRTYNAPSSSMVDRP
jgi:hypothetical protein